MKVYLAGGIWGVKDPVTWRRDVAAQLPEGWEAVDPTQIELFVESEDDDTDNEKARKIVDVDLAAIEDSDAIIALVNQPSWGTAMEIFYAHELGLPVIGWNPRSDGRPVGPWLRVHCNAITADFAAVKLFLQAILEKQLKC